jgi:hypothetical protein
VLDSYFNESPQSSNAMFNGGPYRFTHSVLNSYFGSPQPTTGDTGQQYRVSGPSDPGAPPQGLNLAIPEPASWATMIGGFALVGAVLRRRKASLRAA